MTASAGVFGTAFSRRTLFANRVSAYIGHHGTWVWAAAAGVCLLIALAALRWILALLISTDRAGDIPIPVSTQEGTTILQPAALTGALTREIGTYHGVDTARGRIIGDASDPGDRHHRHRQPVSRPARPAPPHRNRSPRPRPAGTRQDRPAHPARPRRQPPNRLTGAHRVHSRNAGLILLERGKLVPRAATGRAPQRERQKVLGLIGDMNSNRFAIFRSLTVLRQLSLHAGLVDEAHAGLASAKIDALLGQLQEVTGGGHRALVFSQFTGFLGKVRERLEAEGIPYCYLDGSTRDRAAVVRRFKDGTAPVFLISLKAGGFGLNLAEADYCFLLDPWWNPATETQAVDRAHRIGQTRRVMVYRLVAKDTIEERSWR